VFALSKILPETQSFVDFWKNIYILNKIHTY